MRYVIILINLLCMYVLCSLGLAEIWLTFMSYCFLYHLFVMNRRLSKIHNYKASVWGESSPSMPVCLDVPGE